MPKSKQARFSFTPIYLLEFLRTFSSGIMATSIANYLLIELKLDPQIGSLVSASFFAGFLTLTLFFGHLSDKWGQHHVIRILAVVSFVLSLLFLIPISSNFTLALFSFWRFIDGGMNGIFWPTVQKYSNFAKTRGQDYQNKFTSRYALSFNLGFLFGMLWGAGAVSFLHSNFTNFYFNVGVSLLQLLIAFFYLSFLPKNYSKSYSKEVKPPKSDPNLVVESTMTKKYQNISIFLILAALFTHSLFDGAVIVYFPLKVNSFGFYSSWVFILGFSKGVTQTISSTRFSLSRPENILKYLLGGVSFLIITWVIISQISILWLLVGFVLLSGLFQGLIYVMSMKLVAIKAEKMDSARPFTYFQGIMGSGRTFGQVLVGSFAILSLNFGIYILLLYDLIILVLLVRLFIIKANRM